MVLESFIAKLYFTFLYYRQRVVSRYIMDLIMRNGKQLRFYLFRLPDNDASFDSYVSYLIEVSQ